MKLFLFSILILFSFDALGQADLLTKHKGKYFYKDKMYKCVELGVVYKNHQESLDIYKSGLKLKTLANISATVGVTLFLVGLGGVSSRNIGNKGLGALAMGSGMLLELIAIIPRIAGASKLKKARDTFNFEMIERHGYKEDTSLSLQINQGEMALVFTF